MRIFAKYALLPEGWRENVALTIGAAGTFARIDVGVSPDGASERAAALVPGMPNLHSHAFQYAMAGRAERRSANGDDFWSWRETMYALAQTLDPDSLYAIACDAYRAMLRAGYTSVVEFHYLHRDPHARWYAEKSAMAKALIEAARAARLPICLLPALYVQAGPGCAALATRQRRFETSVDDVFEIARDLRATYANDPYVTVGACAHSLRAVPARDVQRLVEGASANEPIHLHIAEQTREVDEIVAAYGARPVEWLLANVEVDARWCLVHATHLVESERAALAASGATVALCPTTEANLGDGIFPFEEFVTAGGRFGIGSDSNVTIDAADELRILEYGQRLTRRKRIVAGSDSRSTGDALYSEAANGARVSGFSTGSLAVGMRADCVEIALDEVSETLPSVALDRHIFATHRAPARVMIAGAWRV